MTVFRGAVTVGLLSMGMVARAGGEAAAQEANPAAFLGGEETRLTIELNGGEGPASVEGAVVMWPDGTGTALSIEVRGAPEGEVAGILVAGPCSEDGPVLAKLGAMQVDAAGNGRLTTDLPVGYETIAASAISVEVGEGTNGLLACGEHDPTRPAGSPSQSEAPAPEPAPAPAPEPTPAPEPAPEPSPTQTPESAPEGGSAPAGPSLQPQQ